MVLHEGRHRRAAAGRASRLGRTPGRTPRTCSAIADMVPAMDRKAVVRRFVDEAVNGGRDEVIDELFIPAATAAVRDWFGAFRGLFPDMHMELLDLVAEGDKVVARFACSATHLGPWRGHSSTGRRFEGVDEGYFFTSTRNASPRYGASRIRSTASSSWAWIRRRSDRQVLACPRGRARHAISFSGAWRTSAGRAASRPRSRPRHTRPTSRRRGGPGCGARARRASARSKPSSWARSAPRPSGSTW